MVVFVLREGEHERSRGSMREVFVLTDGYEGSSRPGISKVILRAVKRF